MCYFIFHSAACMLCVKYESLMASVLVLQQLRQLEAEFVGNQSFLLPGTCLLLSLFNALLIELPALCPFISYFVVCSSVNYFSSHSALVLCICYHLHSNGILLCRPPPIKAGPPDQDGSKNQ